MSSDVDCLVPGGSKIDVHQLRVTCERTMFAGLYAVPHRVGEGAEFVLAQRPACLNEAGKAEVGLSSPMAIVAPGLSDATQTFY